METKNTSFIGFSYMEPKIQKLQMQAKIFKENSLNKLNALKSTTQLLDSQSIWYQQAFARLFGDSFRTFKFQLSQHMNNLETLLNAETLHEMDSKSALRQFGNQRTMTVAGARETVGSPVVQQNGIQCFNCKGFGHYAKECRKPKRVKDYSYHKEKMMMCKQAEQGVPLQADWLADTDEEIDEQELEAHYSFMAKIQEVLPGESSSTEQPLEQVQNHDENNVFANERRHSEQPESINDTYVLEKDDSNVTPDSSNICNNDNQVDQNAAECVDERAALANLIANLTLDTEENKTILKQLKKANASLTQEIEECKTNLDETNRALGEATSCRDSCLIALQNKQNELEKRELVDIVKSRVGYSGSGVGRRGNNQVKDNKIDLLVQQYEQFIISEDESIDSAFARFNTIITSLKALDEGYSSKNYVRKFLRLYILNGEQRLSE
ncbi:integrase, catalytic region, zinc finger, CCHC-type containing protein [Tanacetum coccineum]